MDDFISFQEKVFKNIFFSVWFILFFYFGLYAYFDSYFVMTNIAMGAVLLSPINWLLYSKFRMITFSKFMFIISCSFYISVTAVGLTDKVEAQYYFIPSAFIPLLIFNKSQTKSIISAIFIPMAFWLATYIIDSSILPTHWINAEIPHTLFKAINFLGA